MMEIADSKTGAKGIKRIMNAAWFSLEGIGSTLKHEEAFRQEIIAAVVMIPIAIVLPVGMLGKALMLSSVFFVLIVELLNSGIEWAIDLITTDRHPFAKRAKDMGSAAVMLSILNCFIIWGIVLTSKWETILESF